MQRTSFARSFSLLRRIGPTQVAAALVLAVLGCKAKPADAVRQEGLPSAPGRVGKELEDLRENRMDGPVTSAGNIPRTPSVATKHEEAVAPETGFRHLEDTIARGMIGLLGLKAVTGDVAGPVQGAVDVVRSLAQAPPPSLSPVDVYIRGFPEDPSEARALCESLAVCHLCRPNPGTGDNRRFLCQSPEQLAAIWDMVVRNAGRIPEITSVREAFGEDFFEQVVAPDAVCLADGGGGRVTFLFQRTQRAEDDLLTLRVVHVDLN